jgi:hypothetical protein
MDCKSLDFIQASYAIIKGKGIVISQRLVC